MIPLSKERPSTAASGDQAASIDEALLRRMRAGDESALASLYDRHGALLFTLAVRILRDRALAQEVVQDTFLRCWDEAARFDPERGSAAAWLARLTRNRAIDLLRSRQHRARMREQTELVVAGVLDRPVERDLCEEVLVRQHVGSALASLSSAQRQAIELSYFGGLTQTEIAAKLGEPLGTIKTRMRSALELLRTLLRSGTAAEPAGRGTAP